MTTIASVHLGLPHLLVAVLEAIHQPKLRLPPQLGLGLWCTPFHFDSRTTTAGGERLDMMYRSGWHSVMQSTMSGTPILKHIWTLNRRFCLCGQGCHLVDGGEEVLVTEGEGLRSGAFISVNWSVDMQQAAEEIWLK